MELTDLPVSDLLGAAADERSLARLFEHAMDASGRPFLFVDRVLNTPRSGRILFQELTEQTETAPLRRPLDARNAAREFLGKPLMREARYDPVTPPNSDMKKGWEVRVARIDGARMVIVWATWVETNKIF